jgi:hypothetical protein
MRPFVIKEKHFDELAYPFAAMPRPIGIRCILYPGTDKPNIPVSSTLQPMINKELLQALSGIHPGFDGYLVSLNSGADRRRMFLNRNMHLGKLGTDWFYAATDFVHTFNDPKSASKIYEAFQLRYSRMVIMEETLPIFLKVMPISPVSNRAQLEKVIKDNKTLGYTRLRLYAEHGLYRFGQATWREHWCMEMAI